MNKIFAEIKYNRYFILTKWQLFFGLFTLAFLLPQISLFAQKMMPMQENINHLDSGITIDQEINFSASPQSIYRILLSAKEFSACTKKSFPDFTDTSASIDPTVGGAFSVFDGHIIGTIVELVPNERVVEAWRVVDWPAGVFSIASFVLKPIASGTKLIFNHVGFPKGLKDHLSIGWQQHYWDAINNYLK